MKDGVSSSETLHQGGLLRFLHLDFVSPPKPCNSMPLGARRAYYGKVRIFLSAT